MRTLGHTTFASTFYRRQLVRSLQIIHTSPRLAAFRTCRFSTMSSSDFRLPSNVQPTHYDLTIKTDLKKEIFEGLVKIRRVGSFLFFF
ncbi:hypothetical protein J3R82DRAFT_5607 [Butyriboletus roseoflavus]|nr:hypothetical protein J3R82DRAFT_5607 [Butyriboletus roseoflavus]